MSVELDLPALKISVFGGFHILAQCGRTIQLTAQKDRALLGFLAVSPGIAHPREKLAALLWSDSGDRQARDSLKQALLRLRRSLDPLAGDPLVTNRQTVMLNPDSVWVDAGLFEALLRDHTAESIGRAASLYNGDLLDGILVRNASFEDWLQVERERLRGLAMEAWADVMAFSHCEGRRECAVAAARRLLSLDPLHEAACRTLMRAHAERGERTQALKLFETVRNRLRQELAVTPEPETMELYQSIRSRRASEMVRSRSAAVDANGDTTLTAVNRALVPDQLQRKLKPKPSIAVLPFVNIGDDPDQDYFADGLTEDIITDLSQVSGLFVASRHSAFIFKGKQVQVQRAARELDVSFILEGSVRAAAGRIRITAQLVDGATGGHIWARRYDRGLDDIFALQNEIAQSIANVLKVKLLPEEIACITSHSTTSVDAYQYHLMGRSFYLRGWDRHGLSIARKMFRKAIEIDPGYARAYAALAACESYLSMSDPSVTIESSVANSLRALELDPNLAEAHAVRGLVLYASGRYAEATPAFERALSLGPDHYETHFFYARNCRLQGLRKVAAAQFEKAVALRPNDHRALGLLASEYKILGRHDEFKTAARQCLEQIEAAVEAHPDNADALSFGGTLLAQLGDLARAEAWAERAIMIVTEPSVVHYNVAIIYAYLGRLGCAMEWLEQAFRLAPEWRRRLALWMKHDQDIDPLRDHPRFQALLHRLESAAKSGPTACHSRRRTFGV